VRTGAVVGAVCVALGGAVIGAAAVAFVGVRALVRHWGQPT
jgi:hypothetical protein